MARIDHIFTMSEPPEEAQARFVDEIGPILEDWGFRLRESAPGLVLLSPVMLFPAGALVLLSPAGGLLAGAFRLIWRLAMGHRLEISFSPDEAAGGTTVEIYGSASSRLGDAICLLGRNRHWPANLDDPDWYVDPGEDDPLSEWDGVEIKPERARPDHTSGAQEGRADLTLG